MSLFSVLLSSSICVSVSVVSKSHSARTLLKFYLMHNINIENASLQRVASLFDCCKKEVTNWQIQNVQVQGLPCP